MLFQGVLAARVDAGIVDKGNHRCDIGCMNEDGREMMPRVGGPFVAPEGGNAYHYLVRLSLALPRYGAYVFFIRVDSLELDSWTLRVEAGPPGGPSE